MNLPRKIRIIFEAVEVVEGAGTLVRRSIGSTKLRNFTPFLLFDHATVGSDAGFPEHPHRGQKTISYLLSGNLDHEDFTGHRGTLTAGDLQFMTAGRGIMHVEMPRESSDGKPGSAVQIWVDLPKALKYIEPRYRYLNASQIPRLEVDEGRVTILVISGHAWQEIQAGPDMHACLVSGYHSETGRLGQAACAPGLEYFRLCTRRGHGL